MKVHKTIPVSGDNRDGDYFMALNTDLVCLFASSFGFPLWPSGFFFFFLFFWSQNRLGLVLLQNVYIKVRGKYIYILLSNCNSTAVRWICPRLYSMALSSMEYSLWMLLNSLGFQNKKSTTTLPIVNGTSIILVP